MTLFQQKFKVHPVGQGLFYSGQILLELPNNTAQEYKFVFDCGSMNKTNCLDEIEEYHNVVFPENETLDLLVISHFDKDHVNHIFKLLENRKVKKIITPFLNFNERFLLVLRWIEQSGSIGTEPLSFFTLNLLLDPVNTLSPYLDDEEGEIVFINSGPDKPFFTEENSNENFSEELKEGKLTLDFGKDLSTLESEDIDELKAKNIEKVKKTTDANRPTLKIGIIPIMEFLFYRKQISNDETKFYDEVYKLFIEKFVTRFEDSENPTIDEITDVIKTIRTATEIIKIFKKAKEDLNFIAFKNTKIQDLNTTALCLLHRNKQIFYAYLNRVSNENISIENNIIKLQKFEGLNAFTKIEYPISHNHRYGRFPHSYYRLNEFPNVLLTSDSFLLNEDDVNALYNRYKNYWLNFWLFQIPHHGSSNNANVHLLSKIPYNTTTFINYGVVKTWGGKWRHPSPQLISDLTATGHSFNLIPINEFAGLEFKLVIRGHL
jgi:hypothetical protein